MLLSFLIQLLTYSTISLNHAENSYASDVLAYIANGDSNINTDAHNVLGEPVCRMNSTFMSLGGGYVIVDMGKKIQDKKGTDLRIHEVGPDCESGAENESYEVFASTSASGPWRSLGQGKGVAEFDLGVSGLVEVQYIKIEDRSAGQPKHSAKSPGADII